MGFQDIPDQEIIVRMKDLSKKGEVVSGVYSQYAEELFDRYHKHGYNIARYYGLRKEDASDAMQTSFIKAFASLKSFDVSREFKPWYFKIVMNCIRDKFVELKRNQHSDISVTENISSDFFEEFHIRDTITGIINMLPNKLKEVLILRIYAEMNYEDISKVLGLSTRQIHNRLNKAYELVKSRLQEERL